MNNDFYNSKFTISGDIDDIDIPFNFDIYSGSNSSIYMQIKEYEFNNDEFYDGHLIVRDKSKLKDIDLDNLNKYKLTPNNVYFYKVEHSGFDWDCKVDDSVILCSSWVVPFVLNEHKIDNLLYGEMATHRVEIKEFNQ